MSADLGITLLEPADPFAASAAGAPSTTCTPVDFAARALLRPRSSRQRAAHRGARGEHAYGSAPEAISAFLGGSSRPISVADSGSASASISFGADIWSGTSFPSENSSSAGSMATGSSWRRNSKSSREASGWPSSGGAASAGGSAASWLKEIRGPSQAKSSDGGGGERATLFSRADAITEEEKRAAEGERDVYESEVCLRRSRLHLFIRRLSSHRILFYLIFYSI